MVLAKDVREALGPTNSRDAISKLDDDEKGVASTDTLCGRQELQIVSEGGLYALVLRCRDVMTPGSEPHRFANGSMQSRWQSYAVSSLIAHKPLLDEATKF